MALSRDMLHCNTLEFCTAGNPELCDGVVNRSEKKTPWIFIVQILCPFRQLETANTIRNILRIKVEKVFNIYKWISPKGYRPYWAGVCTLSFAIFNQFFLNTAIS